MIDKKVVIWRVYVVFLVLMMVGAGIVVRVFAIQNNAEYKKVVEQKSDIVVEKDILPMRGNIFSSDGSLLATSDPVFNLHWDAGVVENDLFNESLDSLALGLSAIFDGKSSSDWKTYLTKAKNDNLHYVKIATKVSRRDLAKVNDLPIFRDGQYRGGLIIEKQDKRKRQFSPLADRTIGYVRTDSVGAMPKGKVGLEDAFDKQLAGVKGRRKMRKLSSGKYIPYDDKFIVKPENGKDLITTIDVNLQDVAQNELKKQLESQGAANGCAIVMEVETGHIKAIVNLGKTGENSYYENYNYAIGTASEPGSTFKLASTLVALEDGVVDLSSEIDTEDGTHKFYDRTMRDSRIGGYGVINLEQAFANSSNVYFSKMIDDAYNRNPQKFVDGIKRIMGQMTGISLRGEARPYIKDTDDDLWSGVSLPWTSIGYETKFTPLQILTLYNAVANDGVVMRPQLVSEIRVNGDVVDKIDPYVISPRLCSPTTIKKAKKCMEAVVEYGTGKSLQGANYTIAGKTGTTQLANGLSGYKSEEKIKYRASFCGYFPADKPKYSCIVVVAAPQQGKYGAEVAGTVFKAIADKVYATDFEHHNAVNEGNYVEEKAAPLTKPGYSEEILLVAKELGIDYKVADGMDEWVMTESESGHLEIHKKYVGETTVPNVKGMGLKDALYVLENRGFVVKIQGSGKVIAQSLEPGKTFKKNDLIKLKLK